MTTKIKAAQHLDEQELNKLLKYLSKNQLWTYYIMVRLGVSTALRFSDLSSLKWGDVLHKRKIIIKEKEDQEDPRDTHWRRTTRGAIGYLFQTEKTSIGYKCHSSPYPNCQQAN